MILPGVASAVAYLVLLEAQLRRLRAGLFEAAYTALRLQGPACNSSVAPRPGQGRERHPGAVRTHSRTSALDVGHSRSLVLARAIGGDENCIATADAAMAAGC